MKEMQTIHDAHTDSGHNWLDAKMWARLKKNKVSKMETKMGSGGITCATTASAKYTRRKSRDNGM
jgi:hypothetical protein